MFFQMRILRNNNQPRLEAGRPRSIASLRRVHLHRRFETSFDPFLLLTPPLPPLFGRAIKRRSRLALFIIG